MSDERRTELRPVRFEAAALVCKDCRGRKNGPRGVETKAVVHELKAAGLTHAGPRVRIVRTNCLGVCPKHALTVALVGHGGPVMALVASEGDARTVASRLAKRLSGRADGE